MSANQILTEIAVFTPESALTAAAAGANRIELCSGYAEGGLSPSAATIQYVKTKVNIPVHVMIRPRTGDFVYSETEKEIILQDIAFCKSAGVEGVVLGALSPHGGIDKEFTARAVKEAHPMEVTFHRAFDLCSDLSGALEDLITCGVKRVLTSGGKPTVILGEKEIAELVDQAADRIIILPGGGIQADTITAFIKNTGVKEIHFSAKRLIKGKAKEKKGIKLTAEGEVSDYTWYECDGEKVKAMREVLSEVELLNL
ncbi:MAG: copper homeostasis protein CutC [Bacteroidetes bacterium]|nr:MAG: copper homeostasis protein CutC [Bacteroidota bacterium]